MKIARSMLLAAVAVLVIATATAPAQAGGKMVVTFKDDVSTLDPAIGYDWQNWSMIKSLFDGLMDYKPGTTDLVPELAESYEISPDGTQYTFKLHPEAKFHNGRPITADDVKWSIERAVNPKTQSPGAGFFSAIKGFEDANSGKTETLSGIVVIDPHTVRFDLSRPDATFLHVLQLNFSFPVPKEEVERLGADFGKSPVGSGAYKLKEWTLGQRIVFVRRSLMRSNSKSARTRAWPCCG
jgi:ABC-type transport system substrate-binding protein